MDGMFGSVGTTVMGPTDHFFTQEHHRLLGPSLHTHNLHPPQERITLQNTAISPEAVSHPAFFPDPGSATATESISAANLSPTTGHYHHSHPHPYHQQQQQQQQQLQQQQQHHHHYRETNSHSPASSHSASSKRKANRFIDVDDLEHGSDEVQAVIKRQRNTMAARKYRQKRLDRISDLERALCEMTGERDDLKLQLARREAEVEALREMLGRN